MINIYLKIKHWLQRSTHYFYSTNRGAATLMFAVTLMVLSTLIIIFAANFGRMQERTTANLTRNNEAYLAGEAGLEFGLNYLKQNRATIVATQSGGFINYSDANTTNITLANNSRFSVVYTNPNANNYDLILITSTGTSGDTSSTRVLRMQAAKGSLIANTPTFALASKGSVALSGNATIINTATSQAIQSASTVGFSGNAHTVKAGGVTGSSPSGIGSDVTQNSSALANMSQDDFFASVFGTTSTSTVRASMEHVYSSSTTTNYSSTLNGMTGTTIWIDQTNGSSASFSANTVIGSAANPVLLVVNGGLTISGNVTIYGFIFNIGTSGITTLSGNNNLIGGIVTSDNMNISGNTNVTYNPTVLDALKNNSSMMYYAKVPGSWKDY